MPHLAHPDESIWDLIFTGITAVGTLGLLVVAFLAFRAAKGTWEAAKKTNEQMRADSIAMTRPYVFVETLPSIGSLHSTDIRITNAGKSSAVNLHLEYDAWPNELDDVGRAVKELFETRRTLPPGCTIRSYWHLQAMGRYEDGSTEAGLPRRGTITVYYHSDDAEAGPYSESFPLMTLGEGRVPMGHKGTNPSGAPTPKHFYKLGQEALARLTELARR